MGIRFKCSTCGKALNVKAHQAGVEGECPQCGANIVVPNESTILSPTEQRRIDRKKRLRKKRRARELAKADHSIPDESVDQRSDETTGNASPPDRTEDAATSVAGDPGDVESIAIHVEEPNRHPEPEAQPPPDSFQSGNVETAVMAEPQSDFLLDKPANAALAEGAPDPLNDTKKVWYVRHPKEGETGPVKSNVIRTMLDDKKIIDGCFVLREDWEDWEQAADVFKHLKKAVEKTFDERVFTDPKMPIPTEFLNSTSEVELERKKKTRLTIIIVAVGLVIVTLLTLMLWKLIT